MSEIDSENILNMQLLRLNTSRRCFEFTGAQNLLKTLENEVNILEYKVFLFLHTLYIYLSVIYTGCIKKKVIEL